MQVGALHIHAFLLQLNLELVQLLVGDPLDRGVLVVYVDPTHLQLSHELLLLNLVAQNVLVIGGS